MIGTLQKSIRNLADRIPGVRLVRSWYWETRFTRALHAERLKLELVNADARLADPLSLARFEQQVCSQTGEDGVINEIFRRIGTTDRFFVEFGVEDGLENNTHYLLHRGWSGFWIEGNPVACETIESNFAGSIADGKLRVRNAFITSENIESLFGDADIPTEFDLLSIDIDGNDYWVWSAIKKFRPRVVVIEYNAHYLADHSWIMPYDPNHRWSSTSYYGASLKALEHLGLEKGYRLVGCSLTGLNAFFVREDLAGELFPMNRSAEYHYQPLRGYLVNRITYTMDPRITIQTSPDVKQEDL